MARLNLTDLLSDDPKVKYACSKSLLAQARENPAGLYRHLDFFVKLLEHENRILKWTAIDVVGALAGVDDDKLVDGLLGRLAGFLDGGNMITAHHAITALTDIALARPEHRAIITGELLKVEHYNYDTADCRNITIGKVILAISAYFNELEDKTAALEFVRRQLNNTRNATRKKAEQFLKKYDTKK